LNLMSIGELLLDAGKITTADAEKILLAQKEKGLRFGDTAKALNLVYEEDIQQALSKQFDFSFLANGNCGFSKELIAAYQPFAEQAETLRNIRSQLMLLWFNKDRKTLAITSPSNGEGRSYLAANLAIAFSQLGKKTLLIDADLRKARQHQLFGLDEKRGLSDLLAERADISVISQIPVLRNLSILSAGTIPPNPSELISRRLSAVLEQMALDFDVILLDTPAGLMNSESQLLAAKARGALLLARLHQTRLADLEAIKHLFESTGIACVGTVISNF